jgi:hypothetical protein
MDMGLEFLWDMVTEARVVGGEITELTVQDLSIVMQSDVGEK